MIIGIGLVLLASILQITLEDSPNWIWFIFIAGLIIFFLGLIWGIVDYVNLPKKEIKMVHHECLESPKEYIGTPTPMVNNEVQNKRGFYTTEMSLSTLQPSHSF